MTDRSAAPLPAALRRALADPTLTVGFYDRRAARFDVGTAGQLMGRAAITAGRLLDQHRLAPGQPVLVVGVGPEHLWLGYLAALLAGGVPLLVPARPGLDRAADVAHRLASVRRQVPDGVLAVAAPAGTPVVAPGPDRWASLYVDPVRPGDGADLAAALIDGLENRGPDPSAPLHLQLTSGSTGEPRPVVVTRGNAEANVASFVAGVGVAPGSPLVCWLPLYHDLALVGSCLVALLAGRPLRLLSPFDFLADPVHWLRAVAASPGAVSAAPNFALDQVVRRVDPERHPDLDLSGWHTCIVGAAPVDLPTVGRFVDRLAPLGLRPETVRPGYGLAEATLAVSVASGAPRGRSLGSGSAVPVGGPVPAATTVTVTATGAAIGVEAGVGSGRSALPPGAIVACLGPPVPGVGVEIVDPGTGRPLGADEIGEVVVTGPSVSPGHRRPDGTVQPTDGRCATGDLGFLHRGELHLVERQKNVIIRHGGNWSGAAIEARLSAGAGIPLDRCAVVQAGLGSARVTAVVERGRGRADGDADLLAGLRSAASGLEPGIDEILLVRRGVIPRTTSGKKQHLALRAALAAGHIEVLGREVLRREVLRREAPGGEVPGGEPPGPTGDDIDLRTPVGPPDAAGADGGVLDRVAVLAARHARRLGWVGGEVGERTELARELGLDSLAVIELVADLAAVGLSVPDEALEAIVTVGDLAGAARSADDGGGDGTAVRLGPDGVAALMARLGAELPQLLCRVDAQRGRQLLIDGRWVTDLASVNYLGLDLDPSVSEAVVPLVERWGTHPSWTRIVASPAPYHDLEAALARLTGAADALVFPTVTLTHLGLLPLLATRADTLVVDRAAHRSVQEAAELAAARGATLLTFEHRDPDSLARALEGARGRPVVAVNGVYSMTGTVPDLAAIVEQAAGAGGLVYVDDAHGIGVLGRHPGGPEPYGTGGGGVVAHLGLGYDHVVYVAGLSKAFSSMGAFVTCRDPDERARFEQASTAVFSGPVPVASLATALAGLAVNAERGDELRRHLHRLTVRTIEGARERGWPVDNPLAFPVVNLVIGGVERTVAASKVMWEHGILFTPSVFPAAPLDRGGFRVSFTAANTDDDVDRLLAALDAVTAAVGPPPALVAAWSSLPDA